MSQSGQYRLGGGSGAPIETITGNSGGPVGPDGANNINLLGGNNITVAGNPGTFTLTASVTGTTNHTLQVGNATGSLTSLAIAGNGQIPIGSVGADPVIANITPGTGISIANGAGTITISTAGSVSNSFPTDSGTATPALGVLNIFGGSNISTSGAGNTVTVKVSGTTNHSLQLGNGTGSLTSLGVATNGQLPIGAVGSDPVLATLTAGTGISITNGAGSITIAASGTTTLNYTNVNTTPYVVLSTDEYLSVDCSGGSITVQLPNTAALGREFVIKDRTGSANTNPITVTTVGGVVNIDGSPTYSMNTQYAAINIIGNSSTYEIF